jgi:hypothetical protein
MDPVTLIVTALATGAAAAAKDAGGDAVKSAFNGLKALIAKKFGKASVESAIASVEQNPDSDNRKGVLKEELETAGAAKDEELLAQVQAFLKLLEERGVPTGVNLSATNITATASQGSTAVGPIQVGGNLSGDVKIGGSN